MGEAVRGGREGRKHVGNLLTFHSFLLNLKLLEKIKSVEKYSPNQTCDVVIKKKKAFSFKDFNMCPFCNSVYYFCI